MLVDVVFMQTVGMRPVVVHGGGKAISEAMDVNSTPTLWTVSANVPMVAALALASAGGCMPRVGSKAAIRSPAASFE